jgi:hypothetical protein
MPQGVEHIPPPYCGPGAMSVRIPLMPQGVEHLAPVPSTLPAVLVLNGPLVEPRGGIFMRYATLAFETSN